jgi:GNAT superfamily N-acetyltransferase
VDPVPVAVYAAGVRIRPLAAADVPIIAAGFAALGWPGKQPQLYRRYLDEQTRGERVVWVAERDGRFAGYACVVWISRYEPFRTAGIPEIVDVNVLPEHRRRGVATALMAAAETTVAPRSESVGLGCGLYADYGPAMLLYLARGTGLTGAAWPMTARRFQWVARSAWTTRPR